MDDIAKAPLPDKDYRVEISDAQVEFFREHGFVSVERITTDAEVAWLRTIYDELFSTRTAGFPGGYFDLARPYDSPGADRLPQVLMPELKIPELRRSVYYRNARYLSARLLGVDEAQLTGWGHMILKPARDGHALPWHQDESYWDPALEYCAVGAWLPLDDATPDNGCMCFLPGSHRFDVLTHRHVGNDPAVHALEAVGPIDTSAAVAVPLRAGGATFHHPRTLHYTGPNRTDGARRAYANEFQTTPRAAAVRAHRPWIDDGKQAWAARVLPA